MSGVWERPVPLASGLALAALEGALPSYISHSPKPTYP